MKRLIFLAFTGVLSYLFYNIGLKDSYPQIGQEVEAFIYQVKDLISQVNFKL